MRMIILKGFLVMMLCLGRTILIAFNRFLDLSELFSRIFSFYFFVGMCVCWRDIGDRWSELLLGDFGQMFRI